MSRLDGPTRVDARLIALFLYSTPRQTPAIVSTALFFAVFLLHFVLLLHKRVRPLSASDKSPAVTDVCLRDALVAVGRDTVGDWHPGGSLEPCIPDIEVGLDTILASSSALTCQQCLSGSDGLWNAMVSVTSDPGDRSAASLHGYVGGGALYCSSIAS